MKKIWQVLAAVTFVLLLFSASAEATLSFTVESIPFKASATGGYRFKIVEVTLDNAYAGGGWAITAANCGLTTIKKIYPFPTALTGTSNTGVLIIWDKTAAKLKCYKSNTAAVFQECGAADANGAVTQLLVIGN
jgi:hypothetical protein